MSTSNYCVAWFTSAGCELLSAGQYPQDLSCFQACQGNLPDLDTLKKSQCQLECSQLPAQCLVIAVIPDAWVTMSQHPLDSYLGRLVAPIAALSFAVESSFLEADRVAFSYQQQATKDDGYVMDLVVCDNQLRHQVCLPFWQRKSPVVLLSYSQYKKGEKHKRPLHTWRANKIQRYKPDQVRVRNYRLHWCAFILCCFILQLSLWGGSYFLSIPLEVVSEKEEPSVPVLREMPKTLHAALVMSQALPTSVRVLALKGDAQVAKIFASMTPQDLDEIVAAGFQQFANVHWQHEVVRRQASLSARQEVHDVVFTVESL